MTYPLPKFRAAYAPPVTARQPEQRPPLVASLSGRELERWYWLKSELVELARTLGVRSSGGKAELTARLVAALDGAPPPRPSTTTSGARSRPSVPQLAEPLTPETVFPVGQRCTQQLRAFLVEAIGPRFRFDGAVRTFVAEGGGRTLGDIVDHWWATRESPQEVIGAQFEFNRFLRDWHLANPGRPSADARRAWRTHRSLPVDRRLPPMSPVDPAGRSSPPR